MASEKWTAGMSDVFIDVNDSNVSLAEGQGQRGGIKTMTGTRKNNFRVRSTFDIR